MIGPISTGLYARQVDERREPHPDVIIFERPQNPKILKVSRKQVDGVPRLLLNQY